MQTLEAMVGVPPSTTYVNQMPEGQPPVVAWTQAYVQPTLEPTNSNANPYIMNVMKPDQTRVRVMEPQQPAPLQPQSGGSMLPPTNPASVITATYNPTYNRCLPKILSDLDCEMKIKQVLKCIENILLDGNDMDQPSYKLPDRSASPQLVPKKKIKVKDDEEMSLAPPMASTVGNNSNAVKAPPNKSPVRINVKVEPFDTEKATRGQATNTLYPDQGVPSTSPRSQSYDFPANRAKPAANFPKPQQPTQRAFSFEPYAYPPTGTPGNVGSFVPQAFLQHPQAAQHSALLAQQQHLQAVQQHLQAQQQLLSGQVNAMQVIPLLQNHLQYPVSLNSTAQTTQDSASATPNQPATVPENAAFASVQMDEFPFPVFSSTILEEVNQFKSAGREEGKKPADGEEVFFFGGGNPNLVYPTTTNPEAGHSQHADNTHPDPPINHLRLTGGLGSSSLLTHPSLPLLFQMPQLSGLEEDDKWILSLLNIDGHENVPPPPTGF